MTGTEFVEARDEILDTLVRGGMEAREARRALRNWTSRIERRTMGHAHERISERIKDGFEQRIFGEETFVGPAERLKVVAWLEASIRAAKQHR